MNTPTSTIIPTSASNTPTAPLFAPLDFLQQFVGGIHGGAVFRTADGSPILSTLKEGDAVAPAQLREAFDIVASYFKPPGLSQEMNVDRVQRFATFLAEIVNYQHRYGHKDRARFTAYELGNAAAALQAVLKPQTPTGHN